MKPTHSTPCPDQRPPSLAKRLTAPGGAPVAMLMLGLSLMGCKSPQSEGAAPQFPDAAAATSSEASAPQAPVSTGSLRLNEGDLIRINFEADTNMATVTKIQMQGNITLPPPLTGDIKAAGKTIDELEADLKKAYEKVLKISEIDVILLQSAAYVTVSGAVLKPGRIPLERPLTALDAVLEAGGHDPSRARLDKVTIVRTENKQVKTYTLDLKKAMKGLDPTPFYLKPFDSIHVTEKRFNF